MSGNSLDWRKTRLNDPSLGQYLPRERSAAAGRGDQQADRPERRQPDAGAAGLFCRLAAPLCFPNLIS